MVRIFDVKNFWFSFLNRREKSLKVIIESEGLKFYCNNNKSFHLFDYWNHKLEVINYSQKELNCSVVSYMVYQFDNAISFYN